MLRSKIVNLKETYKFCFNHFLIKCTVFVLIVKNVIKNQKFNFLLNFMGCEKILKIKVVFLKKLYKFHLEYFLIGIIFFLLNMKNAIE